jgi:acyl-CoA thioesterase-1
MLKELIESFKNWLRDKEPQLIPIPIPSRNDEKPDERTKSNPYQFRSLLLVCFITLMGTSSGLSSEPKNILFLGDSITAGYGIDENLAFPAIIQQKIDATDKNYNVINAGLSGETSSGGLRRVNWLLRSPVDILVLELGANDGLRGIDLSVTVQNLQGIIDRTKEKYPSVKIVIAGMQVPPNLGESYTKEFREMFPKLAAQNDAYLIPFILEGVAGESALNLPDGIHPTADGHKILAENVWKVLSAII